jgi:hypothetical protein
LIVPDTHISGITPDLKITDCMFVHYSFFEILKNKKKNLFCTFVDFEKAFDTVWCDALWYKMLLKNINGNMYQVILNMFAFVFIN